MISFRVSTLLGYNELTCSICNIEILITQWPVTKLLDHFANNFQAVLFGYVHNFKKMMYKSELKCLLYSTNNLNSRLHARNYSKLVINWREASTSDYCLAITNGWSATSFHFFYNHTALRAQFRINQMNQ